MGRNRGRQRCRLADFKMINLKNFTYGYQAIDMNHLSLIQGLLVSSKPKKILGVGTGNVSQVCLDAIQHNQVGHLTCIDNWQDWKGNIPKIAVELKKLGAEIITKSEKDFVHENLDARFDFIISDGAHGGSHKWCNKLYDMLNRGGVLIAHDVTNPHFTNLREYQIEARRRRYDSMTFSESTRKDERCERGLLVVYKS